MLVVFRQHQFQMSRREIVPSRSRAVAGHLRELEGDVTVDARDARVVDPAALWMFVDFAKYLVRRGNGLVVRGLSGRPAKHHADTWPGSRDLRYRVLAGRLRAAAHDKKVARARVDVG